MTSTSVFFRSPAFFRHSCPIHRVIPFLIIALVLYRLLPFMLPSTCILPSKPSGQKKPKLMQLNTSTCMASLSDRKIQKASYLRLEGASTVICGCVSFVLVGRELELILFSLFRLLGLSTIGIDALWIRRICRHEVF